MGSPGSISWLSFPYPIGITHIPVGHRFFMNVRSKALSFNYFFNIQVAHFTVCFVYTCTPVTIYHVLVEEKINTVSYLIEWTKIPHLEDAGVRHHLHDGLQEVQVEVGLLQHDDAVDLGGADKGLQHAQRGAQVLSRRALDLKGGCKTGKLH
jgi:hypothetical protein